MVRGGYEVPRRGFIARPESAVAIAIMTDRVNNEIGIGGMNALRAFKSYPDHILLVGGAETQYRCEGSFEVINAADMDEHLKACPMLHTPVDPSR
jgi:hypothetical protein